uniref:Probable protein-export membrane protein SecG n=1 Tax=Cryptomonas sp. SAG 977-2f TaxID=279061 RepID=A0A679CBY0_9CRYP|nr:preprotein translocase secG subunit [Cryptomonas sp. SAG 977-2f]
MLHNFWCMCSIALIFFILIHNPKSSIAGSQGQIFGNTRVAERVINNMTWIFIILFFLLTITLSATTLNT